MATREDLGSSPLGQVLVGLSGLSLSSPGCRVGPEGGGAGGVGGLGVRGVRPGAGRALRALALLPRVLDRQEEGLAVGSEGRSGELRLHGPTGELEHVSTGDPAVYT